MNLYVCVCTLCVCMLYVCVYVHVYVQMHVSLTFKSTHHLAMFTLFFMSNI